jgi:PST family polysaccharide transporter
LLRSLQVVPDALMQRRFSFLRRMVIEPAGVIAFGTAAIIACANDMGVWGLVIGFYAAAVADLLLTWILVRWRPRLALASVGVWRELIAYGRHIIGAVALQRITELLPVLLIGRFVGANPLGQYRYAQRMTSTPLMVVVQGAAYVLFPALARITEDRDRYRAACLRSLRLMCALAFPLGLILIPLGLPAATLLFGEVWRDAGYAAMAMAVFPAAGAVVSFASEALKADGRPDILTRVHVVIALASAAAMLALLPFDLVGVVAGIAIGTVAGAVYSLVRVGGLIEVSAGGLAAQFAPTAAAALIMAALLTPLEFLVVEAADRPTGEGLVLFAAQGIAGIALYAAALRTLAPATAADLWDVAGRALRGSRGEGAPEPEAAVAGK